MLRLYTILIYATIINKYYRYDWNIKMKNIDSSKTKLSISLALSGGGARGTFHLGFIQALQENNVEIKAISGTSAGALVGGTLACGLKPKEVLHILKSNEFKNLFKFNWFRKSIFKINYNSTIMDKLFTLDGLSKTKIPFYVCVTDIKSHESIYLSSGEGKTVIAASCSIVPVLEPIIYENKILADGGILDMMPTTPLTNYEYPILGINLMPDEMPEKQSFFSLTKRVWHLLLTTNLPQDIKRCRWYIAPLEITKIKIISFNNLQEGFDLGYEYGLRWCKTQL